MDEDHLPLLALEYDFIGSGDMGRPKKVERPGAYARSIDTGLSGPKGQCFMMVMIKM
jgi:hypothetical protein